MECALSPTLTHALQDPVATDICVNGAGALYVDRGAGLEAAGQAFVSGDELKSWVLELLGQIGKAWDAKHPFIDAVLPSGFRLHVVFPPVSSAGLLVSLRRLPWSRAERPGESAWARDPAFAFLRSKVQAGDTVILCGATGSGKTTLLNALLSSIPAHERILSLEDTPELKPQHPHFLTLQSRPANADGFGQITLRELLRQTLRMRPDRIVLGEVRGPEVMDLLQLLNTGHRGALATLHANSCREGLRRIELLSLLAAEGRLTLSVIREFISLGVKWMVHLERSHDGLRSVREIAEVAGREGDTILLRPIPPAAWLC